MQRLYNKHSLGFEKVIGVQVSVQCVSCLTSYPLHWRWKRWEEKGKGERDGWGEGGGEGDQEDGHVEVIRESHEQGQ